MAFRFGTYTFPNYPSDFSDNFKEMEGRALRLPGLDGGFDPEGSDSSPNQVGRVTLTLTIVSATPEGMDALRDALSAIASQGVQRLVYDPPDPSADERWCFAKVKSIFMPRDYTQQTDLWHKDVRIEFQVEDPHWYVTNAWPWTLGDGSLIGDVGLEIGSGAEEIAASGTSTSDTITQNGNTHAVPMVAIVPGSGNSCENPRIQRIVDGAIVDEIAYTGVINATDELYVDGRTQTATLNVVPIFGSNFRFLHPDFMRLAPGENTIKVLFKNGGDEATVLFWFNDTYR